jgi:hypothetical protein
MAQSPEYPDLQWIVPRSWTNANRTSVQLIVIHTTEGSSHSQSAEDGARYNQERTDGTSAHYFVDSNSVVQGVRTADQAHTARTQGNRRGIQYELCGRAGWSASTWQGSYQQSMLRLAAKQCARDAKKWNIPVRHLTVGQVADGVKGFCGHWDITRAFPQDNGSHTDPGSNFPWSQFLDMVREEMEGDTVAQLEQDDLDNIRAVVDIAIESKLNNDPEVIANQKARPWQYNGGGLPTFLPPGTGALLYFANLCTQVNAIATALPQITDDIDETALANNITQQLIPALGPSLAQALLAELDGEIDLTEDQAEAAAERAIRRVLGGVDGATPPTS